MAFALLLATPVTAAPARASTADSPRERAALAVAACSPAQCCTAQQPADCRCPRRDGRINLIPIYYRSADRCLRQSLALYWHRQGPEGYRVLAPLYWHWWNEPAQESTRIIGPWYSRRDAAGVTQTLLPLFWRFVDTRQGASTSLLLPLALRHRRPDGGTTHALFPFYFSRGPGYWRAGLIPLLFAGAATRSRHAVVFPVLWHLATPRRSTTVVGPGFYSRSAQGWSAGLAPVFFAGADRDGSYQALLPLFWHHRGRKPAQRTLVAGPTFYRAHQEHGRLMGALPLIAGGHWKGRRHLAVPPLLFYRRTETGTPYWLTWAGPYLGYRQRHGRLDALLPALWYGRHHDTRFAITPIAAFRSSPRLSQGFVGPLLWHRDARRSVLAVAPLFVHHRDLRQRASTSVLFPLLIRHVSPQVRAHVFFPLFWRVTDREQRSLVAFPLLWLVRKRSGYDADVLLPIYWRFKSPTNSFSVAGPAFWQRSATTRSLGLVPLALYRRGKQASFATVLPLFFYHHAFSKQQRTWALGPAYFRRYRQGYGAGLLPLFFHKRTPERRYTVLAPLAWHFAQPSKQRSLTIVGPVVYHASPNRRALGIAPIFYSAVDRKGGQSLAVLPLFYFRREAQRKTLYTPLFGFTRGDGHKSWYAFPYLRWRSPKRELDVLFPLGVRHRNPVTQQTTLVSLPAYFGRWSPGRSLHLAFPLVWRARRIDSADTVVFPLYWDFHSFYRSRTFGVFPLFMHHRNHLERVSWLLTPPGVWVRRRPGATDLVVFPLLWHYGGQTRSSSVLFPLYWDLHRGKRRSTVLFPLFWRFDRPDHRTTLALNTYYRWDKRQQTTNLVVFPFLQVKRKPPRELHVDVLGGLFGYDRTAAKGRVLRLFFIPIGMGDASSAGAAPSGPAKKAAAAATP